LKNKYLKYTLKGLAIFLGVLVIVYLIVFAYVSINKDKIIKQVTQKIGDKVSGNVTIGDVDISFFKQFPSVGVALQNVQITDTMYAQHKHVFFKAEEVFINVGLINMLTKSSFLNGFRVDNGSFYLYTDTSGYTNKYLFKSKDSSKIDRKSTKNELKNIVLNNVRVIDDDRGKPKLHDIIIKQLELDMEDKDPATFLFTADANVLVNSLAFNLEKGSYIKGKTFRGNFDVRYDKKIKQLQFDSVDIKLDDQAFKSSEGE
jgi:hypothetical protein